MEVEVAAQPTPIAAALLCVSVSLCLSLAAPMLLLLLARCLCCGSCESGRGRCEAHSLRAAAAMHKRCVAAFASCECGELHDTNTSAIENEQRSIATKRGKQQQSDPFESEAS